MTVGCLVDLTVLDLTQGLAGPYCTMLLADLGARVIKVEPPGGDGTRRTGPFAPDDRLRAFGGYFQSVNRGKESVVLDLQRPQGREAFLRLVPRVQVLVENFRVGVMERLGLGYETLRAINPRLVYAAIRGFGDPRTGESPYVRWPAYDVVAQAMGGIMSITGPDPNTPVKVGPGIGDILPAMFLALGIVGAVRYAERTGRGQFLDVAMYDAVLAVCERIVYQYSYTGQVPGPEGNGHPLLCPFDLFPTRDGWVAIAAPRDHLWRKLCAAMGRPELGEDPRFATNEDRVRRAPEVRRLIADWTSVRTKAEVVAALGGVVPCGPLNDAREILQDPHVVARGMVILVEHPGCAEPKAIAGPPIKLTETPAAVRGRAPLLGEHTRRILAEAGYGPAEVEGLIQTGVAFAPTEAESKEANGEAEKV